MIVSDHARKRPCAKPKLSVLEGRRPDVLVGRRCNVPFTDAGVIALATVLSATGLAPSTTCFRVLAAGGATMQELIWVTNVAGGVDSRDGGEGSSRGGLILCRERLQGALQFGIGL
jgi:hypothetical protein